MMNSQWTNPKARYFLTLAGPDAVRFLNGQVSNNIAVNLQEQVIPACLCGIKGRLEALLWITSAPGESEALLIETDSDPESVLNRLDRYLIADDCELSLAKDIPKITHMIGDEQPPDSRICWRYGIKGYDLYSPADLDPNREIDDATLEHWKVRHGIPEAGREITGEEFPAELGLDRWAVDFHKGCYLGQEIVSRIHSVGKTKNQLLLCSTETPFEQGHVFAAENGKPIGRVTRASLADPDEPGNYLTSIFAKRDFDAFRSLKIQYPKF